MQCRWPFCNELRDARQTTHFYFDIKKHSIYKMYMVICQLYSYKSVLFVVRVALKSTVNKTVLKLSYWWMLYFCKKKPTKLVPNTKSCLLLVFMLLTILFISNKIGSNNLPVWWNRFYSNKNVNNLLGSKHNNKTKCTFKSNDICISIINNMIIYLMRFL